MDGEGVIFGARKDLLEQYNALLQAAVAKIALRALGNHMRLN